MNAVAFMSTNVLTLTLFRSVMRSFKDFTFWLSFRKFAVKNSAYISRRFLNSISINECFISVIFILGLFC